MSMGKVEYSPSSLVPEVVTDLTINPNPTVSSNLSIVGSTTFCNGGSVQLGAEYNADYLYKWKRDGNYITETSNVIQADLSGNYSAEVSTANNCSVNRIMYI